MLKLALPNKGRLAEDTRELFADAGVTGRDLVSESGRPLVDLLDLEFGRCRLVVAAREESGITRLADITGAPRVATPFPNLTRGFFERLGRPVEVVPVSGAAEIAPHLGIADIVVDLTTTGSTLRMNGLREIAPVLESSARLIASPRLTDGNASEATAAAGSTATVTTTAKAVALGELVSALTSVLRARGQRYVMANVPRAALERVKRVLPGLNGPTVVDVLDGGEVVAVHAVAPAKTIYRTIRDLKALGAEGILVTRIERLMP